MPYLIYTPISNTRTMNKYTSVNVERIERDGEIFKLALDVVVFIGVIAAMYALVVIGGSQY